LTETTAGARLVAIGDGERAKHGRARSQAHSRPSAAQMRTPEPPRASTWLPDTATV
jgi:hypothetical protein